jgi:hypothetical protein
MLFAQNFDLGDRVCSNSLAESGIAARTQFRWRKKANRTVEKLVSFSKIYTSASDPSLSIFHRLNPNSLNNLSQFVQNIISRMNRRKILTCGHFHPIGAFRLWAEYSGNHSSRSQDSNIPSQLSMCWFVSTDKILSIGVDISWKRNKFGWKTAKHEVDKRESEMTFSHKLCDRIWQKQHITQSLNVTSWIQAGYFEKNLLF